MICTSNQIKTIIATGHIAVNVKRVFPERDF